MVLASQLRDGMAILFENQPYRILSADYHPGQGQQGGSTHARLHNLDTGTSREHSFRGELRLQELAVQKQGLEFLYMDADQCCFMDPGTFEQTEIPRSVVGPGAAFLEAGMRMTVEFLSGRPLQVLFPDVMDASVADTAPSAHQQADSGFKPAKLGNGIEVMVPQFIATGDAIRVDLRSLKYVDRAKVDPRKK